MTTTGRIHAVRSREGERGSALLIVFVFAAIILIMLYRELPVASFEAQRQIEQLTVDRGHEYQRAVQLYYRRFRGQYPARLEQLENTNGIRFLRRRYKDPLTGKDDWRLLKAGPGGILLNSKLTQNNTLNGANTGSSTSSQNGNSQNNSSNQTSSFGSDDSSSSSDAAVAIQKPRHSAPAISASGGDAAAAAAGGTDAAAASASSGAGTPTSAELDQDPSKPLLPKSSDSSGASSDGQATPGGSSGDSSSQGNGTQAVAQNQGGSPNSGVNRFGTGAAGGLGAGGIAGVAPQATGSSIKKINDQDDYSLWEFFYDPSKDTGAGGQNGLQNAGPPGVPTNGSPGFSNPATNSNPTQPANPSTTSGESGNSGNSGDTGNPGNTNPPTQ